MSGSYECRVCGKDYEFTPKTEYWAMWRIYMHMLTSGHRKAGVGFASHYYEEAK